MYHVLSSKNIQHCVIKLNMSSSIVNFPIKQLLSSIHHNQSDSEMKIYTSILNNDMFCYNDSHFTNFQ